MHQIYNNLKDKQLNDDNDIQSSLVGINSAMSPPRQMGGEGAEEWLRNQVPDRYELLPIMQVVLNRRSCEELLQVFLFSLSSLWMPACLYRMDPPLRLSRATTNPARL